MAHCHQMKVGEVYLCKECGLELKVVKECRDAGLPPGKCRCAPCTLVCCGQELVKK
jgi:hypothetical protein